MTAKSKSWFRRSLGWSSFSPGGLLIWAAIIAGVFLSCHAAGLREYTTVISGTWPTEGRSSVFPVVLAGLYVVAYFAFVLLVPILVLASAVFLAVQLALPSKKKAPAAGGASAR